MILFFRRLINSKLGAFIGIAFLALVAFAFAAGDITGSGFSGFSGFGSGGKVAQAGGRSLSETDLQSRVQRAFEQQRRETPGLTIEQFLAAGAVEGIAGQLISAMSIMEFAQDQGVHVSRRLVDGEIASIPAFHDAAGKFSATVFRQMIAAQGLSEQALRDEIEEQLAGRLMVAPAGLSAYVPDGLILPYASLALETREGRILAIPSAAFAPSVAAPTDAQLVAFYKANAARFTVPEQRRLRYAVIEASRFAGAATPSEAEIGKYYTDNRARYAAQQKRGLEQLIFLAQSGAQQAAAQAKGGAALADVAKKAGLEVSRIPAGTQTEIARATSAEAAKLAFAGKQGDVIGPVRLPLGWAVLRVSASETVPEVSLAAARADITETLRKQKEAQLLADFTAKLEDEAANGATFEEVTKDNGLAVATTPLLVANGRSAEQPGYQAPADVAAILNPGFEMEADDDAQLAPLGQDQSRFALIDVAEVVAAAPPPLAKVKEGVVQQYRLSQGAAKAKALAEKLRAQVKAGTPLDKAVAGAGVALPAPQKAGGMRMNVLNQQTPPPVALLYGIPKGAAKLLPIGNDQGFYLVVLDSIVRGDSKDLPKLATQMRGQFGVTAAGEYAAQFERAIAKHLGATRDKAALDRVARELRRANGQAGQ